MVPFLENNRDNVRIRGKLNDGLAALTTQQYNLFFIVSKKENEKGK